MKTLSTFISQRHRWYDWLTRSFPRLAGSFRQKMGRQYRIFPVTLSVELTNRCNASCIMCPRRRMTRPQGDMNPDLYETILAEAAWNQRHLRVFQPFLFGESLLHPDFERMIRRARERLPRTRIYLSTNGSLLSESKSRAILEAGVNKLNVDIDGLTAPVAESIRRHVKLGPVVENVGRFLALRAEMGGTTRLRVSIIRMPQNQAEIPEFVRYWSQRAEQVQVVDLNTWLGEIPEQGGSPGPRASFDFPCTHPYEELAIGWDGRASLCCLDFDFRHALGSLPNDSIKEIWNSRSMERARDTMEAGDYRSLPICHDCNAARFQQHYLWRHMWRNADRSGRRPSAC